MPKRIIEGTELSDLEEENEKDLYISRRMLVGINTFFLRSSEKSKR